MTQGIKGYVPLSVSIKHNSVVRERRLVLNILPCDPSKEKCNFHKLHFFHLNIGIPCTNQMTKIDWCWSRPGRRQKIKGRHLAALGLVVDQWLTPFTHSTTILPDHLSLFQSHLCRKSPQGGVVKDEIKRIFKAEVSHYFTLLSHVNMQKHL